MGFLRRKKAPLPVSAVESIATSPHQMPAAEFAWLSAAYDAASVILEYGSGKSTLYAAGLPGKTVFSVESDAGWMGDLQEHFEANPPASPIHFHHGDIGPTREWGNPVDDKAWRRFHTYPVSVWDRADFVHPDLVLIDGRFRMACFVTTLLRITRPVTVLFDDYTERPQYHRIETFARPVETRGRMAKFELTPTQLPPEQLATILEIYTVVD